LISTSSTPRSKLRVFITVKGDSLSARYRWEADVENFAMPVRVTIAENRYALITPTTKWQTLALGKMRPEDFRLDTDHFYADLALGWTYLDTRLTTTRPAR